MVKVVILQDKTRRRDETSFECLVEKQVVCVCVCVYILFWYLKQNKKFLQLFLILCEAFQVYRINFLLTSFH